MLLVRRDEPQPGVLRRHAAALGRLRAGLEERQQLPGVRGVPEAGPRHQVQRPLPSCAAVVFLQHDVVVHPAEPEGGHTRAPHRAAGVAHPRPSGGVDVDGAVRGDRRRGRLHVDGGRQHPVVQGQRRLDQPCRAGRRLRVAHLRLDAAHGHVPAVPGNAHELVERRDLHLVAGGGARAVRLHQLHRVRRAVGVVVRAPEGRQLAVLAGGVDALGHAVARTSQSAQHGVDAVPVAVGVGQPLEREHPDALADQRAVGLGVEGTHPAAEGQRRCLAEAHERHDGVVRVAPAGDHQVGAAADQLVDRGPHGGQRTGARRVHGVVGRPQVQAVGEPAGDDVPEDPGERVLRPRRKLPQVVARGLPRFLLGHAAGPHRLDQEGREQPGGERHEGGVGAAHAQHHARTARVVPAVAAARAVPQHLAAHHQTQQLDEPGGVEGLRRHAELHRVERHRGEEATAPAVGLVGGEGVGVVVVLQLPPGGGNLLGAVAAGDDVVPERAEVAGLGEHSGHPHDGHRVSGKATVEFLRHHASPLCPRGSCAVLPS